MKPYYDINNEALQQRLTEAQACLGEAIAHVNMWVAEDNLPHPEQLRKWVRIANASLSIPGGEPGYAPGDCYANQKGQL